MRGKKAKLHKTMLKERNKPTPPPPDVSSNLKDSLKRWEDNYG